MAYDVIHKNSTVAGTPPTASEIEIGEIAINAADAELYLKDTSGNIKKIANTDTTGTAGSVNFTQAGTGAAPRTVESKLQDVVSVKDFGAVGDGVADDSDALKAMWDHCNSSGKAWSIPAGNYFIGKNIILTIKTSGVCHGKVVFDKQYENSQIVVDRDVAFSILNTATWSPLTRGTINANAASAYGMTVWIESTEILAPRYNPPTNIPYYKREIVRCDYPSGAFSTPIVNTYDSFNNPGTYTTTVYGAPRSTPICIKNLNIYVQGTSTPTASALPKLLIKRDCVTVEDLTVEDADPSAPIPQAVNVQFCADVHLIRPNIKGLPYPGLGYGIIASPTIGTVVKDGNIQNCRHAITGRNNVDFTVDGGLYSWDIDDHWGDRMVIKNLSIYSSIGTAILYAGNDLTVSNVRIDGVAYLGVAIRTDVCHIGGDVVLDGITVNSSSTGAYFNLFGYSSGITSPPSSLGNFPAGYKVKTPDSIFIKNINLNTNKTRQWLAYLLPPGAGADPTQWENWKHVNISGNLEFNGKLSGLVYLTKNSTLSSGYTPRIEIDGGGVKMPLTSPYILHVTAPDDSTTGRADVTITNVKGFNYLRYSGKGVGNLSVVDSEIVVVDNDLSQAMTGTFASFFNCTFSGGRVNQSHQNCLFSNCRFTGTFTEFPSTNCSWVGCVRTAPQSTLPADIRDNVNSPYN